MRTLKLALAAVAAFAFNADAASPAKVNGMGTPPTGVYQTWTDTQSGLTNGTAVDNLAFHAGGVAACDGCHVMHNAGDGVAKSTIAGGNSVAPWTNVTNMYLLQGSDQSSTCLICHGTGSAASGTTYQFTVADTTSTVGPGVAPSTRTPGGDFAWVKASFTASPGDRHGHNVAAADFGFVVDNDLTYAPGGTWIGGTGKKAFACSSCHDPHGRYRMVEGTGPYGVNFAGPSTPGADVKPIAASGSYGAVPSGNVAVGAYRLLAGQAYAPASNPGFPFPNNPPIAVAPRTYNQDEGGGETYVAYGTGMSEWCQNCHTNIHLDGYVSGVAGLRHPAGSDAVLHAGQYQVYNSYLSSGKMTGTNIYTSLVPFEAGAAVTTLVDLQKRTDGNIIAGPQSAVMCLSCHRAHASAFDSMVRWDQNATFLTDGDTGDNGFTNGIATDRQTSVTKAGYYGRTVSGTPDGKTTFGPYQRSLCNKCHGKD